MTTLEQTRTRDPLIVQALANGASYREAAEQTGVSPSTVARRMRDPRFREIVDAERESVIHQVRNRIARLAPGAVDTLAELADGSPRESVRLGAARAVLEFALSRRPGMAWMGIDEFERWIERFIAATIDYVPTERRARWLEDVTLLGRD